MRAASAGGAAEIGVGEGRCQKIMMCEDCYHCHGRFALMERYCNICNTSVSQRLPAITAGHPSFALACSCFALFAFFVTFALFCAFVFVLSIFTNCIQHPINVAKHKAKANSRVDCWSKLESNTSYSSSIKQRPEPWLRIRERSIMIRINIIDVSLAQKCSAHHTS